MPQPAYRVVAEGPAQQRLDVVTTELRAAAQAFIDWVAALHYHCPRDPIAELREIDDFDGEYASDPGRVVGAGFGV